MRLRFRFGTALLLVTLIAITLGACRWAVSHRAKCLTRSREHESVYQLYEVALAVDATPSWASPKPHDEALRREYAAVAARHREAARLYAEAANRIWMPLPKSPPDLPRQTGFLPIP
jgi:hypothetical protein